MVPPGKIAYSLHTFLLLNTNFLFFSDPLIDSKRSTHAETKALALNCWRSTLRLNRCVGFFQVIASQSSSNTSASLWHVNAHKKFFKVNGDASVNGHSIDFLPILIIESKNCTIVSVEIPYAVENQWLSIRTIRLCVRTSSLWTAHSFTQHRAICMRPINSGLNKNFGTASFEFNLSEWVKSPRDDIFSYCFFDSPHELPGRSYSNWYSARLLCKMYGAALTDSEDYIEFAWLK